MRAVLYALIPALLVSSKLGAQSIEDDFDRHDSRSLGSGWVTASGSFGVESKMAKSDNPSQQGIAVYSSLYGPYDEGNQRLFFFSGCESISLISGYNHAASLGIEARLTDSDADGLFDRIEFHDQPDSGTWGGAPYSIDLPAPAAAGILSVWLEDDGDRLVVSVRPFGQSEGQYFATGVTSLPNRPADGYHAVAAKGVGSFDNWAAYQAPVSFLNLVAGARATVLVRSLPIGTSHELFVSLTGWGSAWRYGRKSDLANPLYSLGHATADPKGVARYSAIVPLQLSGMTIYVQAYSHTAGVWNEGIASQTIR